MSLKDKVVIITGGGTGMGADAARGFNEAGAKVVLNGRREAVLAQTALSIDPTGENVVYVAGDIGTPETIQRVVRTAVARFGGIDVLFNNAGVFKPTSFLTSISCAVTSLYLKVWFPKCGSVRRAPSLALDRFGLCRE